MRRIFRKIIQTISPQWGWQGLSITIVLIGLVHLMFWMSDDSLLVRRLLQAMIVSLALLVYGMARCFNNPINPESPEIKWLRHAPWQKTSRYPIKSIELVWHDLAFLVIVTISFPTRSVSLFLVYGSAFLIGYFIGMKSMLMATGRAWVVYLYLATFGGLVYYFSLPSWDGLLFFILNFTRIPLALFGLYCITRSQIPGMLNDLLVTRPFEETHEELERRRLATELPKRTPESIIGLDYIRLSPKKLLHSAPRLRAIAIGGLVAWLSFALFHTLPTELLGRLFQCVLFVLAFFAVARTWVVVNTYGSPWKVTRDASGRIAVFQYAKVYGSFAAAGLLAFLGFVACVTVESNLLLPISLLIGVCVALNLIGPRGEAEWNLICTHQLA